jgi:hypothetical protein
MAKAKRMSDIFASSVEKDANAGTATATPPYSSEGPTLPVINGENATKVEDSHGNMSANTFEELIGKTTRIRNRNTTTNVTVDHRPVATIHPSLYEPWNLLPDDLLQSTEVQTRFNKAQKVLPVVFTRNQNVKAGINRLKTYLGAYKDTKIPIEMPEKLRQTDLIIAISAQGDGTPKLVSILDMVRRVVAPGAYRKEDAGTVDTWWLYISLGSVEVKKKKDHIASGGGQDSGQTQETEEDEAFEPMELDEQSNGEAQEKLITRKMPVLTAWMTKKAIPMFKAAFGEQTFTVQTLRSDD